MPILEIRQCMGEAVYLKMTCLKCGGSVEFPEESEGATVLCPHCGKDLFLYRGVRAVETPPAKEGDFSAKQAASAPVLWNPMAAAYWSLLFSPAFGAFLHAKNAESLGRAKEAKTNMVWFYISLVYLGFTFASGFIFPTIPDSVFRFPALIFYCCWFYVGEKQVKYVKATWRKDYHKKSWAVPLSVAFGCWIVIIAVFIIVSAVIPDGLKSAQNQSPPTRSEAPQPQPRAVPARSQFEWNTTEIDASKNGNIAVAVTWLLRNPAIRSICHIPPNPNWWPKRLGIISARWSGSMELWR